MERGLRKKKIGRVVSDKMDKTIVVAVETKVRHPLSKDKRWRLVEIVERAK